MNPNLAAQYVPDIDAIAAAVELASDDPVWFRREVLRVSDKDQDKWQDELLEAVIDVFRHRDGRPTRYNHEGLTRFSIRSGHGVGKTTGCGEVMHLLGFINRVQMLCTATKFKQVTTRLWPRFRMLRAGAIDEYQHIMDVSAEKIVWANDPDWYASPETATQPDNLHGFHENAPGDIAVVIVDEASGIKQDLFTVLEGALSSGNVLLILIGNPTQNSGEFYDSHNKPNVAKLYYKMHVTPEESSHVSPKWVAQMANRYGVNSPIYKVRVAGEFAETAENQLISHSWIMAALDREFAPDGSFPRLRVAVDVADGGADETVIDAARLYDSHMRFLKQERHSFPPSESPILAADAAERLFLALGGDKLQDDFVVDALGVGAGTAGTLLARGYRVICYKGGESSDNTTLWRNRRVQSYLVLRDRFLAGTLSFADDYAEDSLDIDDMTAQLCGIFTKPGTERVEDLETKQELKDRTGNSPDLADTKAMMCATQCPQLGSSFIHSSVVGPVGQLVSGGSDGYLT